MWCACVTREALCASLDREARAIVSSFSGWLTRASCHDCPCREKTLDTARVVTHTVLIKREKRVRYWEEEAIIQT